MAQKTDVKAIMARFQAGASFDETSSTSAGNSKPPLQSTPSSGPVGLKKSLFETPSNAGSTKPAFLRNTAHSTNDSDAQEASRPKITPSRFSNSQDETSPTTKPLTGFKHTFGKPPDSNSAEIKSPTQKTPFSKTPVSSVLSEPKPLFPKPSVVANSKPSWVKDDSVESTPMNTNSTPPKLAGVAPKPISSIGKLRQQHEESTGSSPETPNKPSPSMTPKPVSNFKTAQSLFNKEKDGSEQTDTGAASKSLLTGSNSSLHPRPPTTKKPGFKGSLNSSQVNGDAPKINPLPNSLALGAPPAKPNRPPKVNLEPFRQGAKSFEEVSDIKKLHIPTPVPSPLSNHSKPEAPPPPALPTLPSLPPRHPGNMNPPDDTYDDVDCPPPLPSSAAHPSQYKKESDDEDGEMYEDLDQRWDENSQDKKKDDKEEKKKLEAERKEQKERQKKEQDARKKFKLTGPIEVIHEGNALENCKGSKTDLALKKDQHLDIIRVMGNPEGKWLGRTLDGSIGYVKTTSVKIDFDVLKNIQAPSGFDPEVYDDIDVVSSDTGGNKKAGVVLPPLPGGEGGEIYDDVGDPNLDIRVPPPSQFLTDGNSEKPGAIDEEIYDDVDSQNPPVPPPIMSLPGMKGRGKVEDVDPKKQKKFEKEEKEFRKKFKYEGEINVLYQVSVAATLTNKKWGGKELSLKPGEKLDVIVKAVDDKMICRNEDGKFGYVSTTHIMDDGEIYDDIGGEDCIYDND
ncbi:FYN-binding protein 1 isoform X2 [Oryzias melastigma]|uniref:FYN binding protein 1 n=1 Tax=Oryzias melastigma TaxID=30732 RepID=A0A3B3CYB6_ORYME|nr:FYN-binding protein 1 isoform X2 [Oryzias melastigma]